MLTSKSDVVVALAGNPNVGKSTIFNALTGLNQHTGNWAGKTVGMAYGRCTRGDKSYVFVDLPGTYSLSSKSPEEEISRNFIYSGEAAASIIVCDATCLKRTLLLAMQTLELTNNAVICVNLADEAEKSGITIDTDLLTTRLNIPVISTAARSGNGVNKLLDAVENVIKNHPKPVKPDLTGCATNADIVKTRLDFINELCNGAIHSNGNAERSRRIDKLITGKYTALPIMLLMLLGALWLTIEGANYPSELLKSCFNWLELQLSNLLININIPSVIHSAIVHGMFRTLAWVVAVMLPPMAIFFPIFTILEDFGLLPRFAFNLDGYFKKACACGKQGLTMCLGLGCNAAGVVGCRIIDSKRERLIAIITNALMPCNGRFPTLILLIGVLSASIGGDYLFISSSSFMLALLITFCFMSTFLLSFILGKTVLRGVPSAFSLELPPYRKPMILRSVIHSLRDKTLFVLSRAVIIALPAGLVIWVLANTSVNGSSLFVALSHLLDPFARVFGLDGVILLAFILGFPANEIVIPIAIMGYSSGSLLGDFGSFSQLFPLLSASGWTWVTALCTMLFTMFHFPCSTTLITVYKETQSFKWTAASAIIPTVYGLLLCFLVNMASKLFVFFA